MAKPPLGRVCTKEHIMSEISVGERRWLSKARIGEVRIVFTEPDKPLERRKLSLFPPRRNEEVRVDITDYEPGVLIAQGEVFVGEIK
jgi:hypothetical protein